ncbi:MAG: hypothetical protein DHS20C18_49640 [Saprospiraceae bacterium]|nr:MAG: hypothetical protein DHS20C18_49640 [Saprospiraceae bacterium]
MVDHNMELIRQEFSGQNAYETTAYVSALWRTPGNSGFDSSIYYVQRMLEAAGYQAAEADTAGPLTYRIERYPLRIPAWDPIDAKLFLAGEKEPLLDFKTNRNMIAINSFATPAEGVEAEVVYVEGCNESALKDKDLKGKIVMADCHSYSLFRQAVGKYGALGVLAYNIPDYNQPERYTHSIPFTSIAFNSEWKSWAINLSYAAHQILLKKLSEGPLKVRVQVDTRIFPSEELTVIAEIRGAQRPDERFVYSAHVQEPGANDNASGVGTLAEMARVAARLFQTGKIKPDRTLTFLWGDEIRSTRRFIEQDDIRKKGIRWGMSLDMVGEDTDKTGGTFLIEKMPDPSAIWTRGADKHTAWGAGEVDANDFNPHYFNDFVEFVCRRQALATQWVVNTNPYEGGSDHQPFLDAQIPGLLMWHFTDMFYHTDADRIDKVSAQTLTNVGISALTCGLSLCTATESMAAEVLDLTLEAAKKRITVEGKLSQATVQNGESVSSQHKILKAWGNWYQQALPKVSDILLDAPSDNLRKQINKSVAKVGKQLKKERRKLRTKK